jgi:hypothetical protein
MKISNRYLLRYYQITPGASYLLHTADATFMREATSVTILSIPTQPPGKSSSQIFLRIGKIMFPAAFFTDWADFNPYL